MLDPVVKPREDERRVLKRLEYIVSKNKMSRRRPYKDWYGDFDFYGSASPLQRKACVLYFISAILTLVFMITGVLL